MSQMASPSGLDLNQPEKALTWIKAFEAQARTKRWTDDENAKMITDNFLALCGIEALEKISFLYYLKISKN